MVGEIGSGEAGGTLRIDAAALEIRHVLPAWLRRLRKANLAIRIELEEVAVGDLSRLASGKSDLLVEFVEDVPRGFAARQVGTHHVFLVAPREHAAAARARLDPASLAGEPFVAFSPSLPHAQRQLDAIASFGKPERIVSVSSTEAILAFVGAGLGYSLIPWPTPTGPVVDGVRAERMRGPGTTFPISAVWRARDPHPLVAAALAALPPVQKESKRRARS